jgi:hypothetical protein
VVPGTPEIGTIYGMIFLAILLGLASVFFGFCFLNLAGKAYDFYTGPAAYELDFLENGMLISGTFFSGFMSTGCAFGLLAILS